MTSITQLLEGVDVEWKKMAKKSTSSILEQVATDRNKRIAAACFIYFIVQNNILIKPNGESLIDNNTLAALTLFIATSKTEEAEIVKRLVISMLNRNNIEVH